MRVLSRPSSHTKEGNNTLWRLHGLNIMDKTSPFDGRYDLRFALTPILKMDWSISCSREPFLPNPPPPSRIGSL